MIIVAALASWYIASWQSAIARLLTWKDVEIEVDGEELFVIRDDRSLRAEVVRPPRLNFLLSDSSGFNGSSMTLLAEGEEITLDPASMYPVRTGSDQ